MRLATRWLVPCILSGASATSLPASFFTFESPNSLSDNPQTISPEVSRLILAKRLGLSQFHRLKGLDDDTLRQVNHFGGGQQPLLRDAGDGRRESSIVIIVEGVENTSDVIPSSPSFFISDPPSSSANQQLLSDLIVQARSPYALPDTYLDFTTSGGVLMGGITFDENTPSETREECKEKFSNIYKESSASMGGRLEIDLLRLLEELVTSRCGATKSMAHFTFLETLAKKEGTSSTAFRDAVGVLRNALLRLAGSSKGGGRKISVLLMPPNLRNAKRSDQPYGSYSLPDARSGIPQQSEHEALLSDTADAPRASPQVSKALPVLKGTIPLCHISLDDCNTATRNCSGRGTCINKQPPSNSSLENREDDEVERACYACLNCKADVEEVPGGGKRTTYWGGTACQKQDVSTPFLLFAGFTILMTGAVTWAIGLLYSAGQEELPGVLAAGVAASRPR